MTVGMEFKDPDSIVVRSIDWSKHLQAGETIATSDWIPDTGMTLVANLGFSGAVTSARLSGGTIGQEYDVTNRITTSLNQTLDQSIHFIVRAL